MRSYFSILRQAAPCCVMVMTLSAHAAPDAAGQGDAVLQLLRDKGLVAVDAVRQARDKTGELVISAMNFIGVPYRRGGNTADDGFDCSGFTRHIFEMTFGLVLPRSAAQQAKEAGLQSVEKAELKPGDLVFFNTMKKAFSHVGIYIGEGKFIHSPRTGSEVRIEDMRGSYWATRFDGARRAVTAATTAATAAVSNAATAATTALSPSTAPVAPATPSDRRASSPNSFDFGDRP